MPHPIKNDSSLESAMNDCRSNSFPIIISESAELADEITPMAAFLAVFNSASTSSFIIRQARDSNDKNANNKSTVKYLITNPFS
jgi:hypothetical protein